MATTADTTSIKSPVYKADPGQACAHWRANEPVARITMPGGMGEGYLVTRYEDALAILRDDRFVKNVRSARAEQELGRYWLPRAMEPMRHHMLEYDGDEHRRLRGLVQDVFAPRYIARLEPRVRELTDQFLDAMESRRTVDLITDFALPLPLSVIAEIMGVNQRDRMRFRRWLSTLLGVDPSTGPSVGMLIRLPRLLAMMRWIRRLVADRRAHPQDDLVSRLAAIGKEGDRLSEDELIAMVFILLVGGYETTVNLIATGTLLLLRHPEERARLRAEPALIEPAVEELLRLSTPADVTTERYAREDVEVAGVTIPRGSMVLVAIASANADDGRFPDAARLDVGRTANHHLAFGQGPHYCLGAPLARLEGRVAMGALIERFPNLRLAVPADRLAWREQMTLRGLKSLPVAL